ncbi:MAG TPA: 3-hydroxyacyl-CoA dehydrogenase family protein [Dehalococcoidia bacterium]|nr:3-hydroxyacyl-CoA dehydrogenase family protein [Dehalococcoidia bacterium]
MLESAENWLTEVKNIAVLGAGTMGHGIGQVFALAGYDVMLYDIDDAILQRAMARIDSNLDVFIENGLATEEAKQRALSKINTTTDLATAVGEADFVLEAIPEMLELKQKTFHDVERMCREGTILASNTSSFTISDIGALCQRQDNLAIAHWFNPPHIVPLVEVVKGPKTSPQTVECICALLDKVGKKPVRIMKEVAGFLANRMQMALFREACSLLERGVAGAEDIDTAVKASFGFRLPTIGVFETMDLAGLDTVLRVAEELFPDIENSIEVPRLIRELVRQGKFGAKTGEGVYQWPKQKLDALIRERDRQFLQRLKQLYLDKA